MVEDPFFPMSFRSKAWGTILLMCQLGLSSASRERLADYEDCQIQGSGEVFPFEYAQKHTRGAIPSGLEALLRVGQRVAPPEEPG